MPEDCEGGLPPETNARSDPSNEYEVSPWLESRGERRQYQGGSSSRLPHRQIENRIRARIHRELHNLDIDWPARLCGDSEGMMPIEDHALGRHDDCRRSRPALCDQCLLDLKSFSRQI